MGALPPYAFAEVERLKLELRRAGEDVVDLGFGNPDLPSPEAAVRKLAEAARDPRNHRYSASKGIPNLRKAICELYRRRFGVELDPEREAITTIGAKDGLSHLMWLLVGPGDVAFVPDPSYPIHRFAPQLAGAEIVGYRFDEELEDVYRRADGRARTLIVSFPHNPTGAVATPELMQRIVDFARTHGLVVVHDFAYADLAYDGHEPPSILQADGAREVAVELYSLTKGFSMAGWLVGFAVGNPDVLAGLARLKSYLDYGTFQPIQIAAIIAITDADDYPRQVCEIYRSRRDRLCRGLARAGWPVQPPTGTMFVWAPIPEPFRADGSQAFALRLLREAKVAVSPGAGFGPAGEGHVRFALVENEQRIGQAARGIQSMLGRVAT